MSNPKKKNHFMPISVGVAAVAAIGAFGLARAQSTYPTAGPSSNPSSSPSGGPLASSTPSAQPTATTERALYTATLAPENASGVNGTAQIVVDKNNVGVFIHATGLDPSIPHPQHIHLGTACATASNDTNGDGFVDDVEAEAVSGPPEIALTLNGGIPFTRGGAISQYPVPAQDGVLDYIGTFPVALLSRLTGPMPAPSTTSTASATPTATPTETAFPVSTPTTVATATATPSPTATAAAAGSELLGHAIELHGVGASFGPLPSTVASSDSTSPAEALPVACGTISQTNE